MLLLQSSSYFILITILRPWNYNSILTDLEHYYELRTILGFIGSI